MSGSLMASKRRFALHLLAVVYLLSLLLVACQPVPRPPNARPIIVSRNIHFGEVRWLSPQAIVVESKKGFYYSRIGGGVLVKVDLRANKTVEVIDKPVYERLPIASADGSQIAFLSTRLRGFDFRWYDLFLLDLASGEWRRIAKGDFESVDWLDGVRELVLSGTPDGEKTYGIWRYSMASSRWDLLATPSCGKVIHLRVSPSQKYISFDCLPTNDQRQWWAGVLTLVDGSIEELPSFNNVHLEYPVWLDDERLIARWEGSTLVLVDLQNGREIEPLWSAPKDEFFSIISIDVNPHTKSVVAVIESPGSADLYQLELSKTKLPDSAIPEWQAARHWAVESFRSLLSVLLRSLLT